jgi:hypothetical protein
LPTLVDCRVDQFVIVGGERNLGPVRLKEILIDVEAFAEGLEGGLKSLDCVLLFVVVEVS